MGRPADGQARPAYRCAPSSLHFTLRSSKHDDAQIGLCIFATTTKLATFTESAFYFDGATLILLIFGFTLYISSLVTGLEALHPHSKPTPWPVLAYFVNQAKSEAASVVAPGSANAKEPMTPPQRNENLGVVAATVVLIGVCLVGVVVLQIGEWFAVKAQRKLVEAQRQADRAKVE